MALSHRLDYEFLDYDIRKMVLWNIDIISGQHTKSSIEFYSQGIYVNNSKPELNPSFTVFNLQANYLLIEESFTIFYLETIKKFLVISWKVKIGLPYHIQKLRHLKMRVQSAKASFCGNVYLKFLITIKSCYWTRIHELHCQKKLHF